MYSKFGFSGKGIKNIFPKKVVSMIWQKTFTTTILVILIEVPQNCFEFWEVGSLQENEQGNELKLNWIERENFVLGKTSAVQPSSLPGKMHFNWITPASQQPDISVEPIFAQISG